LKIPEEFKKYMLKDFDFSIKKMKEEKDANRKLYFFSASFASLERYMRYSLEPQLLLIHAVLNICYGTINNRVNAISRGDVTIEMPSDFFERLIEYLTELRDEIAEDKDTYTTLEKFVYLSYQTTGAGYYTKNLLESSGEAIE